MNQDPIQLPDDNEIDPEEILDVVNDTETNFVAPEDNETTKDLTEWDEPVNTEGHAAHKFLPEDTIPVAEQLIYDGMEEADSEQRIAAVDPDFEP